jgi:hypothetical protein
MLPEASHRKAGSTLFANETFDTVARVSWWPLVAKHLHLYLDESGSRDLDRPSSIRENGQGTAWFGIGGILLREEDEPDIREAHRRFCQGWSITKPLHSWEIRNKKKNFDWLRTLPASEKDRFLTELGDMLMALPVHVTACVIDRAGYDARYRDLYKTRRWRMSKTAFNIVVERAAKIAALSDRKLKVWFEEHSKTEDCAMREYFQQLKSIGMPFDPSRSHIYSPLDQKGFAAILSSCDTKKKSSPMTQIADLMLFPVCKGRYVPTYRPYLDLALSGRLVDSLLAPDDCASMGIKFSCFDDPQSKK